MIAAITLKMLDPFGTGKLVLFQVTYGKVIVTPSYKEIILALFRIGMHTSCFRFFSLGCLEYVTLLSLQENLMLNIFRRVYMVHTSRN